MTRCRAAVVASHPPIAAALSRHRCRLALVAAPPRRRNGVPGGREAVLQGLAALAAILERDRIVDVRLCSGVAGGVRQPVFMQLCQERRMVSTPEKVVAMPLPLSEYPDRWCSTTAASFAGSSRSHPSPSSYGSRSSLSYL